MAFRDIVGHRRTIDLLSRSVERGTLPPSLILAGPAAEKRQVALAVAQALNCQSLQRSSPGGASAATQSRSATQSQAVAVDACGTCPACVRISRGVHADVLILEPSETGTIKIEQVRDVIDRASYRPFEGRRRVVIIDDADALVDAAQNALLKTLEEPPPSSVFMLLTARADVLLATVRSRCIRLSFPQNTAVTIDPEGREVAQRVLAQVAASRDPVRKLEAARDLLTNTGAGGAADREQVASHLRAMASLLRDIALISAHADRAALDNADVAPALDPLVPVYRGERLIDAYATVDRALDALDRNAGVKIVADWVVLHL
jgi:DNA polymerase-3 subunit delta'